MLAKAAVQIILMVGIIAGSVMAMNWLIATKPEKPKRPPFQTVYPVETTVAKATSHVPGVISYGQAISERSVDLRSSVNGEIIWINKTLQAGARIEEGETLLRIDRFAYEGALDEANANLVQTEAAVMEIKARLSSENNQLDVAREQLDIARKDLDRATQLQRSGAITAKLLEERELAVSIRQQAVLQRESNLEIENARLAQQEAAIKRLQWKVAQAERGIADTVVKAPFSGIIRGSNAEVGKIAGPNDVLVSIYSLDEMAVKFTLTDAQFGRIVSDEFPLIGRSLEAFWSVGETEYKFSGKVTRIGADIASDRGGVEVLGSLDTAGTGAQIRPGAFLEIRLADRIYTDVIRIPEDALYGTDTVYLVEDGALTKRDVTLRTYDNGSVLISGDIADGAQILTTRLSLVAEGLKVRPAGTGPDGNADAQQD